MKIFLSGGTGFIGSHFIDELLSEKYASKHYSILAIKREESSTRINLRKYPNWRIGSLTDDWSNDLKNCDVLVHMASAGVIYDGDNWEKCMETNVINSISLWQQAINAGIKRIIILGSCSEYGISGYNFQKIPIDAQLIPTNAYGASKAAASVAAQALCIESKIEMAILRAFHVYGPGEHPERFWASLVKSAKDGKDFEMTEGAQVRDFQYVRDTVRQIERFLSDEYLEIGKPLIKNLGTGFGQTLLNFAQTEWKKQNATGKLLPGKRPYRKDEVMNYVPLI